MRAILAADAAREPNATLALLGDKRFHFSTSGTGFLMYGVSGRSWIAFGPPVGPPAERFALLRDFCAAARRAGRRPAVYHVGDSLLPDLRRLGLTAHAVGEAASLPLAGFSLAGPARGKLRRNWHRLARREDLTFRVAPGADLVGDLRPVSDAWLAGRPDMGFSLGGFVPGYLAELPVAVVRRGDRVVAFAALLATPDRWGVDLMRYRPDAPRSVMEHLLVEVVLAARDRGLRSVELGLAPLAGLTGTDPLCRLGRAVYAYGERWYGFRGLRQFKAKFDPVWSPRYLAAPRERDLPLVLAQVGRLSTRPAPTSSPRPPTPRPPTPRSSSPPLPSPRPPSAPAVGTPPSRWPSTPPGSAGPSTR
ncbi:GNAT family N-acetyltransferase [Micromonospora sp. WMMD812]|uniref:GNAT family N-acetyltransferase n=1 Tax=Micromonospora sp. WMMD812 TaxID=3015152 RepID=UPI0032B2BC95